MTALASPRSRRLAIAVAAGLVAVVAPATVASAHTETDLVAVPAGSTATVTFEPEHGCGDSPTIDMRVQSPVAGATAVERDGWTAASTPSADGTTVLEWSGGSQPADEAGAFQVRFQVPDAVGTLLVFPAVQHCENGEQEAWIETGPDAESPAPQVLVLPAGSAPAATLDDVAADAPGRDLLAAALSGEAAPDDGGAAPATTSTTVPATTAPATTAARRPAARRPPRPARRRPRRPPTAATTTTAARPRPTAASSTTTTTSSGGGGSSTGWIVAIVIAAVVIAGAAVVVVLRRRGADQRASARATMAMRSARALATRDRIVPIGQPTTVGRLLVAQPDELREDEGLATVGGERAEQVVDDLRRRHGVVAGVPADAVEQPAAALAAADVIGAHPPRDRQQPHAHRRLAPVAGEAAERPDVRVLHEIVDLAWRAERDADLPDRRLGQAHELAEGAVVALHRGVDDRAQGVVRGHDAMMAAGARPSNVGTGGGSAAT